MKLPSYQDLSKEQDKINNLPLDGSYLVIGPPGTGKTVMALYRAKKLHDLKRPVVLLMYSRVLSQYTEAATEELGITGVVKTFHSWFSSLYRKVYRESPPELSRFVFDWEAIHARAAEEPLKAGMVPDLIIDEGQDLPKQFFTFAKYLATNITVFADENQRIHEENSTLQEIERYGRFKGKVHKLTRNYRNTRQIALLARVFAAHSATGMTDLPDREGELPRFRAWKSLNESVDQIVRFANNNTDLQIGVFALRNKTLQRLENRLKEKVTNPLQRYEGGKGRDAVVLDFERPAITLTTFLSSKGLEFDAVFIPELQLLDASQDPVTDMQMYVLLSRARDWLFLSRSGDGASSIERRLPKELMEWD